MRMLENSKKGAKHHVPLLDWTIIILLMRVN